MRHIAASRTRPPGTLTGSADVRSPIELVEVLEHVCHLYACESRRHFHWRAVRQVQQRATNGLLLIPSDLYLLQIAALGVVLLRMSKSVAHAARRLSRGSNQGLELVDPKIIDRM